LKKTLLSKISFTCIIILGFIALKSNIDFSSFSIYKIIGIAIGFGLIMALIPTTKKK
jgi:hypothetical protein